MNNSISICVVDSFPVVREGAVKLLEAEVDIVVVAESTNYKDALPLCLQQRPDLLVLGVVTPDTKMLELVRQIKQESPETKVLVLAAVCDEACIEAALNAGADGYLLKTETQSGLAAAIRKAAQGATPLSRPVVETLLHSSRSDPAPTLTRRQIDSLRLVAEGQTNVQIGQTLGISPNTVRYHLRQAFRRLDANSRTEAVMKAAEHNLL